MSSPGRRASPTSPTPTNVQFQSGGEDVEDIHESGVLMFRGRVRHVEGTTGSPPCCRRERLRASFTREDAVAHRVSVTGV